MSNYARIIGNAVVDVSATPNDSYHPDLAQEFVPVPDEVGAGWQLVEGVWTPPVETEPPDVGASASYPIVGPIHFRMLFTVKERLKAKELRAADAVMDDFWGLIEDPRTDVVNLALQSVQAAVEYTLSAVEAAGIELDVPTRKAEILAGVLH